MLITYTNPLGDKLQEMAFLSGPSRRSQNCQGDTAHSRKRCSIEKHGPVTNIIPQQPSDDTRNESRESHCGVVPANSARTQMLRHEIGCECLAHSSEYSLVKAIEDKQNCNHNDISGERKPKISKQEDDEG